MFSEYIWHVPSAVHYFGMAWLAVCTIGVHCQLAIEVVYEVAGSWWEYLHAIEQHQSSWEEGRKKWGLRRFQQLVHIATRLGNPEPGRNSILFTNSSLGYLCCRRTVESPPQRRTFTKRPWQLACRDTRSWELTTRPRLIPNHRKSSAF